MSKEAEVEASLFVPWKEEVLRLVRARAPTNNNHGVVFNRAAQKYLQFLQKYLTLSPTDKAANNVSFVCRRLSVAILKKEFGEHKDQLEPADLPSQSRAYEHSLVSTDDIILAHKNFLNPKSLFGQEQIGYLYALPKFHKRTPKQRFIAALSNCTTTQCSKLLTRVLTLVMNTLRSKDDAGIATSGIRRFFVVDGYEEVAEFLPRACRDISASRFLYTGDFATMYTTIPHLDLVLKIEQCVREAALWHSDQEGVSSNRVCFQLAGNSDCVFGSRSPRSEDVFDSTFKVFSVETTMALVNFLVTNTFILNGGVLRRQKVGIPMGTNCGPVLANLYLYAYESAFIDRLRRNHPAAARAFHMTFRLIDDVLSVGNPSLLDYIYLPAPDFASPPDVIGGIYPSELKLEDTSISNNKVHFVGMTITVIDDVLCLDLFDKRDEFPFQVIRFPHMDSSIPISIPYGVFTGGLYRRYRICSSPNTFIRRSVELAVLLVTKGCSRRRIWRLFRRFLELRTPLRWSITVCTLCRQFTPQLYS